MSGGKSGVQALFLVNGEPGDPYGVTQLQPGDVVTMDAGGGYGDPKQRDQEAVQRDVKDGKVSMERAREDCGATNRCEYTNGC